MIGDPLHDAITRRRDAQARHVPPASTPEGVAFYRCEALLDREDEEEARCGLTAEDKPWRPRPQCHGQPMAITGYDWDSDVA